VLDFRRQPSIITLGIAEPRRSSGESDVPMIRRRYQTGSLVVRGKRKKVWVARWRETVLAADGTLKSIRRSEIIGTLAEFPTRRQAQALLESRLYNVNHALQKPLSSMPFREFVCSQWEPAILPTLKFATQRNYRHLIRRHLFPVFGDQPLCDIKRQHIQGFVMEKMVRQKYSWKTSLHLRNLVSKIFTTAVDWEYVPSNPASGVKLPSRPLRQPLRFLTIGEVARLLEVLKEPERTLVLTAVLTGMRIGELLALRWRNVDFVHRIIRVREAVYEGHNSTPKTQGGIRDVPIGPALEQALRKHSPHSQTSDDSLIFPSRNGTHLRPGNLHKRCLIPACAKAGLRRFSWHDFRRTHATLLSDMGEPLKTAQAQLGHASLSTTAELYAQAVPASQRAAVERLEQAVGFLVDPSGPKLEKVIHYGSSLIQ
jgi:integrase